MSRNIHKKIACILIILVIIINIFSLSACDNKKESEKILYSFGALSDIHLQSADYAKDETNSLECYQKALTFYKTKKVKFIAIAGDIVAINRKTEREATAPDEWIAELKLFKQYNQLYFEKPVYTCTGNHDATPYGRTDSDQIKRIKSDLEAKGEYNIRTFEQKLAENNTIGLNQFVKTAESNLYDGTKTAAEVWEEIIGTPLNFVVEHKGDVFIFFSMYYWNYSLFSRETDIVWLEEKLEEYKDNRVFLFAHLPVVGTFDPSTQGANVAANGYPLNYRFGQLVKGYNNVIHFSGHTHFDLELDGEDDNFTNTYQGENGMLQIHCSSTAYTRLPKYDDSGKYNAYVNKRERSQGYLVNVYKNKFEIKGVDFTQGKNGDFISDISYVFNY